MRRETRETRGPNAFLRPLARLERFAAECGPTSHIRTVKLLARKRIALDRDLAGYVDSDLQGRVEGLLPANSFIASKKSRFGSTRSINFGGILNPSSPP